MVKENHARKTVIMPIALEDRLREHVHEARSKQRTLGIRPNQQATESKVVCDALSLFLTTFEPLKHDRSD